jgi:peptidylprolyl isomerase
MATRLGFLLRAPLPSAATGGSHTGETMTRILAGIALALAVATGAVRAQAQAPDPKNTLVIEVKTGRVLIKLRPDLAPKHVERVKQLAKEGFYNGLKFHRVIEGFMAQTGDPQGTGEGGSKYPDLPAEFTREVYKRGSVGAARTPDPNTANSQFFICFGDRCRGLTGEYTLWGEVVEGMEQVDKIARGEPPPNPDVMRKVYLLADAKK